MTILANETPSELVLEACSRKDGRVDITNLSPEKIRALPNEIAATIIFEGDNLTLHATRIKKLSAPDATRINLPNLKSSDEIWAGEAEISAPALENGGKAIVAKHLNDTKKCGHVGTLILTGDTINLRGVKSLGYADFSNATAIFLHDTEVIGSEVKALKATNIAAPALETLTGYFNTSKLRVISFSQNFINSAKPGACHVSPSADIRAIETAQLIPS